MRLPNFALVFFTLLSNAPVRPIPAGGPAPVIQVRSAENGLVLALRLNGTHYARDALVYVGLTIRNVSRHPVLLAPNCPATAGGVEVVNRSDVVVYPPPLASGPQPECVGLPPRAVLPGAAIHLGSYAVLSGSRLRAHVKLLTRRGSAFVDVVGPTVMVTLTAPRPPELLLRRTPHLHVEVRPTLPAEHGAPLFMQSSLCPTANGGATGGGGGEWLRADFKLHGLYSFVPGCDHPLRWYLAVGWPGESVAQLSCRNEHCSPLQVARVGAAQRGKGL